MAVNHRLDTLQSTNQALDTAVRWTEIGYHGSQPQAGYIAVNQLKTGYSSKVDRDWIPWQSITGRMHCSQPTKDWIQQ